MNIYNEIDCLPNEVWKDVKDFKGVYSISNLGRLASNRGKGWNVLSNKNSKGGYLSVVLISNGKVKSTRIHRLVYEAFVGEIPKGKKYHIHHINGNKQDNRVENLSLKDVITHHKIHIKENPSITKGMVEYNKYIKPKKINQYTLDGVLIATYNNSTEASLITKVCGRNILQVANKEPFNAKGHIRKQAGGFIWKFAAE